MKTKAVWIIDEGSQGHVVQSRGLIRELSKVVDLNATEIRGALKVRIGLLKSLVKRLLRRWPKSWIYRPFHHLTNLPAETPDLIVASGPRALTTLAYLGKTYGCPSVFVQASLEVPRGMVDYIVKPDEGREREDYIFIPLLFSEITPGLMEAKRAQGKQSESLHALFVGASSAKIKFEPTDWEHLVSLVNRGWRERGMRWLITTSYRTPRAVEKLLREGILPDAIEDAVWHSIAPRRVTQEYLARARSVFVTMDSMTMVSEAIASGSPVIVLASSSQNTRPSNTNVHYVQNLEQHDFISIVPLTESADFPESRGCPRPVDYAPAMRELAGKLGWLS